MACSTRTVPSWTQFPAELKFAVVDLLDAEDVKCFSQASKESYALCIPALFKNVNLRDHASLISFLSN
ncbi:hypothetical protein EIP91_011417, partial [Steccherinum ochraceum]